MQRAGLALVLLCAVAASARAQAPKSIDPGMSQAQVVQRLGDPTLSRTSGDFTYLFYKNDCLKVCGIDDVVILRKDTVVDAMFRSPERAYTGKSSSPHAIPADIAARTRPGARDVNTSEVVQAGEPRAVPTKADSAVKEAAPAKKPGTRKTKPAPATAAPDSAERDSIMKGSLRIKVMPKNFTPPSKDSARSSTVVKQPPHEE